MHVLPQGFEWDQAVWDKKNCRGLITVLGFTSENKPQALGTGFIVDVTGEHAIAVTAAHVLKEVLKLQSGAPRHNRTALPVFLPAQPPMKIDTRSIGAVCRIGDGFDIMEVEGVVFDESSDLGILVLGRGSSGQLPDDKFQLDECLPPVGSMVSVLSYGDLSTNSNSEHPDSFSLNFSPVLRVGKVLENHPNGTRLCKGPCITTSIPVYSGMSGGPVFQLDEDGAPMRAFGIVCSDLEESDGPIKQDRSFIGSSVVALLAPHIEYLDEGGMTTRLSLNVTHAAGNFPGIFRKSEPN